jgi:hypothetical protein
MDRRRKRAPEGHQAGVNDKKGKSKERATKASSSTQDHGADPLEIAYGPTVGTHTKITEDDFKVDTETGPHKPQQNAEGGGRLSPGQLSSGRLDDKESPVREESGQGDRRDEDNESGKSVQYTGAEEFQNVWGK